MPKKEESKKTESLTSNESPKREEKSSKKKTIIIISILAIIIIVVATIIIVPKMLKGKEKTNEEEKLNTGSTYGDMFANYLKEHIFNEKEKVNASLINLDEENDPEMVINFQEEENAANYTMILYIEEDTVKESEKYGASKLALLYNVSTSKPTWYLKNTNETTNETSYTSTKTIINDKEEQTEEELTTSTIFLDDQFDNNYVEVNVPLKETEITKDELKDSMTSVVNNYKEKDKIITDEVEQTAIEKMKEVKDRIKKEEEKAALEKIRITQSNYNQKIGEHIKYFVGSYMGADYGWIELFTYKDVTGSVKIPGVNTEYEMVYEVVGLKSLSSLNAKLEEYIVKNKIPTVYPIKKEFIEYNGKVYRARGGIGDGDHIVLSKTKVLSSENGLTKVKLFKYLPAFVGDEVCEEITLTFTYNKDTDKYQITDWSSKKIN